MALSTNGTFVIAWEGDPDNDNNYEILYRRFSFSTGAAQDANNRSALCLSGQDPTNPDVAIRSTGQFVIT